MPVFKNSIIFTPAFRVNFTRIVLVFYFVDLAHRLTSLELFLHSQSTISIVGPWYCHLLQVISKPALEVSVK